MTIVEFLLARIDEDEAFAKLARLDHGSWTAHEINDEPIQDQPTGAQVREGDERSAHVILEKDRHVDLIGTMSPDDWADTSAWVGVHDEDTRIAQARHIARHDPHRVLAECDAKRALIKAETNRAQIKPGAPNPPGSYLYHGEMLPPGISEWATEWTEPVTDTPTLRTLATVYADHPDYNPEWSTP